MYKIIGFDYMTNLKLSSNQSNHAYTCEGNNVLSSQVNYFIFKKNIIMLGALLKLEFQVILNGFLLHFADSRKPDIIKTN